MADNQILKRIDGEGWLVLSGGVDVLSDIRAQALSRIIVESHIVYIGLDEDDHDDLIEDMGELGAAAGFLLNVLTEDDNTIRDMLEDAAMVVIPDGYSVETMRSALTGAAIEGIQAAYERGAVIFAEGESISLFGSKMLTDSGEIIDGFQWVEDTFFAPMDTQSQVMKELIAQQIVLVGVSIGVGSALVLGADQQVETWGSQITIALSSQISHS